MEAERARTRRRHRLFSVCQRQRSGPGRGRVLRHKYRSSPASAFCCCCNCFCFLPPCIYFFFISLLLFSRCSPAFLRPLLFHSFPCHHLRDADRLHLHPEPSAPKIQRLTLAAAPAPLALVDSHRYQMHRMKCSKGIVSSIVNERASGLTFATTDVTLIALRPISSPLLTRASRASRASCSSVSTAACSLNFLSPHSALAATKV